ncbi:MAG: MurR/RpiR family transcriptional regulator, partial [Eubacterium sp.]
MRTEKDEPMASTILHDIRQRVSSMTNRQRMIAHYILSNHEDAAFLTSTELADKSGTSEATVIRFSSSLGFARYGDMQRELQKLVKGKLLQIDRLENSKPPQQDSSMLELARHWMLTDIQSIETTLAGLNIEDLSTVVNALCSAHNIFVVATHGEYGLACYFGHSLSWIH